MKRAVTSLLIVAVWTTGAALAGDGGEAVAGAEPFVISGDWALAFTQHGERKVPAQAKEMLKCRADPDDAQPEAVLFACTPFRNGVSSGPAIAGTLDSIAGTGGFEGGGPIEFVGADRLHLKTTDGYFEFVRKRP